MTNARKKIYFMAKNNEKKTFKIVAWIQKIKKIKVVVHCMLDVQTKVQITSKTNIIWLLNGKTISTRRHNVY